MKLRKRVKLSKLEHNLVLLHNAPAEGRCSRNILWGAEGFKATLEGCGGKVSLLEGPGTFSASGISPKWPWRQFVTMAAGLLLAGLLSLAQAWCVNAIHENLLWFSQLTVRLIRTYLGPGQSLFESTERYVNFLHRTS